jgi:hypothetical protein
MEQDLHNYCKAVRVIAPQTTTVDLVGQIIDTSNPNGSGGGSGSGGQFESLEYVLTLGVIDGAGTVILEQADDLAFTVNVEVVPAAQRLGALPTFIGTDDNQVRRVGVVGKRRFQRFTLDMTTAGTGNLVSVIGILSDPRHLPVAAQATTS